MREPTNFPTLTLNSFEEGEEELLIKSISAFVNIEVTD
jgi:hypothetical protein